ncbi:MAG: CoA-binding protein [Candidatus Thermoplasmatota archaeon]|jgi:predicted CoA-binding protein|nr:CoA-binding protein [Candidatus Thermoplasmatota archaeon]
MIINRDEDIKVLLKNSKNIAVVGISDKQERDSFGVAKYLVSKGYNVIPVNPSLESWQGIKSYPNLSSIPKNTKLDIVDIFRKPEAVGEIVEESIKVKPKAIWMQLGVINEEAGKKASDSGMTVVMDKCIMVEHKKLKL